MAGTDNRHDGAFAPVPKRESILEPVPPFPLPDFERQRWRLGWLYSSSRCQRREYRLRLPASPALRPIMEWRSDRQPRRTGIQQRARRMNRCFRAALQPIQPTRLIPFRPPLRHTKRWSPLAQRQSWRKRYLIAPTRAEIISITRNPPTPFPVAPVPAAAEDL